MLGGGFSRELRAWAAVHGVWSLRGLPFFSASVSSGHVVLLEIMDAFNFAFYQGPWDQRPSGMSAHKLHLITLLITVLSGVK